MHNKTLGARLQDLYSYTRSNTPPLLPCKNLVCCIIHKKKQQVIIQSTGKPDTNFSINSYPLNYKNRFFLLWVENQQAYTSWLPLFSA